jgi:hypothetical protein
MYGPPLNSFARPSSSAAADGDPSLSSASSSDGLVAPRMTPVTAAEAAATRSPARTSSRLEVLALLDRPSRAPLVMSRVQRLARLDAMLDHIKLEAAARPAASRLLRLRLHMLNGLRQVAARSLLLTAPSAADLAGADRAMLLSHRMQLALRGLLEMPESQLAPLVDEERGLAMRQAGLLKSGVISKDANGRSREHAFRAFDVHTAATAEGLAVALSAFGRLIDELCPVPTAADNENGSMVAAGDAPESYDPFGVLPYAQQGDSKRP